MYIQSLLFKPSIKLEKRQLFNDTTLIDLLQELFLIFYRTGFLTTSQLFYRSPHTIVLKKGCCFMLQFLLGSYLPGCTKNGSGYFPTLRRFTPERRWCVWHLRCSLIFWHLCLQCWVLVFQLDCTLQIKRTTANPTKMKATRSNQS